MSIREVTLRELLMLHRKCTYILDQAYSHCSKDRGIIWLFTMSCIIRLKSQK